MPQTVGCPSCRVTGWQSTSVGFYRLRQHGVALLQENQVARARVISLFSLDLICFIPRAEQLASSLLQMFEAEEDGAITEMELAVILKTALGVTHLSVSRLFTAIDSEDTGKITFGERTNETNSAWSLIDLNISKWSLFQTLLCYQRNCRPPFFFSPQPIVSIFNNLNPKVCRDLV